MRLIENTGCKPIKIWLLNRHGTRYPKEKDVSRIKKNLPMVSIKRSMESHAIILVSPIAKRIVLNNRKHICISIYMPQLQLQMVKTKQICQEDFDLIKNWSWNDTIEHSALALPQGWNDLEKLATTYKTMYPTIFDDSYSPFNYTFSHSDSDRTRASCKAFISGLFGTYKSVPMLSKNAMLRVRYICE